MEEKRVKQSENVDLLQQSHLLDYNHPAMQNLIRERGWLSLQNRSELIGSVYTFVRDEIAYGYTKKFQIPASVVLSKGYGNCLTKTTLLLALLRAVDIPCQLHGATISRVLFRGLIPRPYHKLIPKYFHHSWVEVQYDNTWLEMGGHIIDMPYLLKLQEKFPDYTGSFYGYGLAALHFKNPKIKWEGESTFIQKKAIEKDLGVFNTPDEFFTAFPEAEAFTHTFRYRALFRNNLNSTIMAIRRGK